MNERIQEQVARFPEGPGVYVFQDARGRALYVGKAANLRARVRQYLRPGGDGRVFLRFLEHQAETVEFLSTRTVQEALLLENTLIKQRKPACNIRLKDDKAFLLLRLDRREPWPWFRLVRRRYDDGAEYLGPYATANSVRRTLRLLHKVVPLRDCSDPVFHNRSRPCLKHQIGRCPAPCVGLIDRAAYDRQLDEAVAILRGRAAPVLRLLREQMATAAASLEFERAQALKLQIQALERVAERQHVVGRDDEDIDAVGLHRAGDDTTAVFLQFREGQLESSRRFAFQSVLPEPLLLADLLQRYYEGDQYVPATILVPDEVAEQEIVGEWLTGKRGGRVEILQPERGAKRRYLELAQENARLVDAAIADAEQRRAAAAGALAALLACEHVPERIHCLDVSTIQGRDTVASRVSFLHGQPEKAQYRRFRISPGAAGDDFAALEEAVRRSLTLCLTREHESLPDLLLVDGGRGQLTAAQRALDELGIGGDVRLAGLAKSRLRGVGETRRATAERLFVPERDEPVSLAPGAPATLLVAAIRDEAHRFAITYHRQLRQKITSELDAVAGIGPARRRALLRHFGSLAALRRATVEAIAEVPGVNRAIAQRLRDALAGARTPDPGDGA